MFNPWKVNFNECNKFINKDNWGNYDKASDEDKKQMAMMDMCYAVNKAKEEHLVDRATRLGLYCRDSVYDINTDSIPCCGDEPYEHWTVKVGGALLQQDGDDLMIEDEYRERHDTIRNQLAKNSERRKIHAILYSNWTELPTDWMTAISDFLVE